MLEAKAVMYGREVEDGVSRTLLPMERVLAEVAGQSLQRPGGMLLRSLHSWGLHELEGSSKLMG